MIKEDYDGAWGEDYNIQDPIGFGTFHPYQGYINISAKLKYLVDNDPDFKVEFCKILINIYFNEYWMYQMHDYKPKYQDPFDDIRESFKHKLFEINGIKFKTKYGILTFDKRSGWPGLDISIITNPIKYPFMVWFKNYKEMAEMVRLLKDYGFIYFNPFFNGNLKEPETFDTPWLYFDDNKRTYLLGISAINSCDLKAKYNISFKNVYSFLEWFGGYDKGFFPKKNLTYKDFELALWKNEYWVILRYKGSSDVVKIPSSYKGKPVKVIYKWAFIGKSTIRKIIIPEGIEILKSAAFSHCQNLKEINLPSTIRRIEDSCFEKCNSLVSIFIPSTLLWIEDYAFKDNNKLTILMEDFINQEGANFKYWDIWHGNDNNVLYDVKEGIYQHLGYKYVKTSTGICIIDYIGKKSILSLPKKLDEKKVIGATIHNNNVKTIKVGSEYKNYVYLRFSSCDNLETVIVENGIDVIQSRMFYHLNSLKTVILPKSVNLIKEEAFYDCPNLKTVYIPNTKCIIEPKAFEKPLDDIVIYDKYFIEKIL